MSKTNNFVFKALYIITWIIFIGLFIEMIGLFVNLLFSIFKPEFVPKLYQKLDLTMMYKENKFGFYGIYVFILTICYLKTSLFYIVLELMHKIDLTKPFNSLVSRQILLISYYTLSTGLLVYIGGQITKRLVHHDSIAGNLEQFWTDGEAFILMGAVVYIIGTIFKKGVDLQTENDLTI
ncbi:MULTISPECIES: DUF2975 domain-containing protein [unclassified Sphingobacterium]|uniref:DUF2975 domain-containing protein n=1 Tax=unclassified Sphingobacterium TaxID=2609468 RepID=UPI0025D3A94A|nr:MULTISPECIES: DUF2975 domain-containing protein [unclassified Sphingobacterium]